MAYPFFRKARTHKTFSRLAGNLLLNSTSWADLPTIGTTWDATLRAGVDDRIRAELNGGWNNEAVWAYLDVVTVVGGVVTNSLAAQGAVVAGGSGVMGWRGPASAFASLSGAVVYPLAAGDIASGAVTLRVRYKTLTAANKTLYADANSLFQFSVENIGPAAA